ncbi:MAG: tRNA 2-thiouridine(34) synthase MnmA [Chloroflexota bacterium]
MVAMSGGVDSSVAAWLLRKAGCEVVGLHMHLWCEERQGKGAQSRHCCSVEDVHDAEDVCRLLGIPFYVLNLEQEFQACVVDYFCREYLRGRTPNPCLACNEHLKFRLLLQRALALDAEYLATGHYARIERSPDGCRLLKGVDAGKDQSYFLYMLGQAELARLLFPVGERTKEEVRRIASEIGLPVAKKADSVEVCFVADGDYRPFIAARFPRSPGDIVDREGRVLGRHQGLAGYTIGQRQGLGLSLGRRFYVVGMDVQNNRLVVGPEEELYSRSLLACNVRWVGGRVPDMPLEVAARIRYRSPGAAAVVSQENGGVGVRFVEPQRAVTPGQAVVFYLGEEVLGGGIIERSDSDGERPAAHAGGRARASGAGV